MKNLIYQRRINFIVLWKRIGNGLIQSNNKRFMSNNVDASTITKNDFLNKQGLKITIPENLKEKFENNPEQPKDSRVKIFAFINIPKNITEIDFSESIRHALTKAINNWFIRYPHKYYNKYHFDLRYLLTYDPDDKKFVRRDNKQFILNKFTPELRTELSNLANIINNCKYLISEGKRETPAEKALFDIYTLFTNNISDKINGQVLQPISLVPPLNEEHITWYHSQIELICDKVTQYHVRRPCQINIIKYNSCIYKITAYSTISVMKNPFHKGSHSEAHSLYIPINITEDEFLSRQQKLLQESSNKNNIPK